MDYLSVNRESWNRRAEVHFVSQFYDVDGFLAGKSSLTEIELAELPNVSGQRLLHLQCHFGLDTLSLARMGAFCTGVDLSPVAIDKALELKRKANLDATFICSDIYNFDRGAEPLYDIVFTSYGVVCWLPDLRQWAEVISANLTLGGTFYMAEFHPVYDLIAGYSYFEQSEPDIEEEGTYTENSGNLKSTLITWAHPLSSVINALINAGIEICCINEYPFSPYPCFEGVEEHEPGKYYLPHLGQDVPLVYTIQGRKAA